MKTKNCHNCKHGKTHFGEKRDGVLLSVNKDSVLGNMYGKCEIGKMNIYIKWWKENGHKKSDDVTIEELNCYKPHKSTELLDNMINNVNEMLDLLKK